MAGSICIRWALIPKLWRKSSEGCIFLEALSLFPFNPSKFSNVERVDDKIPPNVGKSEFPFSRMKLIHIVQLRNDSYVSLKCLERGITPTDTRIARILYLQLVCDTLEDLWIQEVHWLFHSLLLYDILLQLPVGTGYSMNHRPSNAQLLVWYTASVLVQS